MSYSNSISIDSWETAMGTAIGLRHEENDSVCQDRVASFNNNFVKSVALADGAGSRIHSHFGADFLTKKISKISAEQFDTFYDESISDLKNIYKELIQSNLQIAAQNHDVGIKELSSTLLFVVTDGLRYILGHLGDGMIASIDHNNEIQILSEPHNDEYANFTYFTTSLPLEKYIRIEKGILNNIRGFILMSDGSSEGLYLKSEKKFSKVLIDIASWIKQYSSDIVSEAIDKNLKQSIRYKTSDDCSLAFLVSTEIVEDETIVAPDWLEDLHKKIENVFNWYDKKYLR
jgi:serine/threonine protein phosphatase PrpC